MLLGKPLPIEELCISQVLIVDGDTAETERLTGYIIEAFPGCEVIARHTLAHTLQTLRGARFDFIILDLALPDSNGLETLDTVIHHAKDVPVLVYTDTEDMKLALKSLKMGAQDYLIKGRGNAQTLKRIVRYSTERKRIEQQLHHNEHMLRTFIRHVPAGIAVLDNQFRIVIASDRWKKDHGVEQETMDGRRFDEVLHHAGSHWMRHYQACLEGEHFRCPEEALTTNEGREVYIKWEMMPWFDSRGEIGGVIEFTEFITNQRQLRLQLEDANQYLEKRVADRTIELVNAVIAAENAKASKEEFFANITHELRTPLHAIINFSKFGMTKAGKVPEETLREYFSDIHDSGLRLLGLVNDVLDFSYYKSGKSFIAMEPVDIKEIFFNARKEMAPLLEEQQIEWVESINEDCLQVIGDVRRIHQVMTNLISNAIKFSEAKTRILVCARPAIKNMHSHMESGSVVISISDQGSGIPEGEQETIFDAFIQSKKVRYGGFVPGTGLGLAICRQIIQAHDGVIWAKNNADRGATLSFTLPIPPV